MPKITLKPKTPAVKMTAIDHRLVVRLADVEGRTLQGVVTLALRQYAKRRQPAVLTEVYGSKSYEAGHSRA